MRRNVFATSAAAAALLIAAGASAQQTQQQPQQQGQQQQAQQTQQQQQPQVAEQCMADLREFGQEAARTGYGAMGPAGYGARAPVGGWYGTYGPRRELDALLVAAEVFARSGREEACQTVLSEIRDMRDQRMARLEEAGIPPEEVQTWRQERLALAQPVEEVGGALRVENILGADIRNLRDEDLGDIEDVVFDDRGRISYVLLSRGGFLGIGQDMVPVPWEDLRAIPELDTFVLDVQEEVLEQAPTVDREVFADLESYGQRQQEIDSYWQQEMRG